VHIHFSNYDCASLFELGNATCILSGYTVFETLKSRGRFDPGRIVEVFDPQRNAMQRATPFCRFYLGSGVKLRPSGRRYKPCFATMFLGQGFLLTYYNK